MNYKTISPENILKNIIDFKVCKKMVSDAKRKHESMVILCCHYSINIASKFEDGEQLQWDLDELGDYLGYTVEVSDYDDMVIHLTSNED